MEANNIHISFDLSTVQEIVDSLRGSNRLLARKLVLNNPSDATECAQILSSSTTKLDHSTRLMMEEIISILSCEEAVN